METPGCRFNRCRTSLACGDAYRLECCRPFAERMETNPITGAAIGLNAAFLNIVTEWLSDIKRGYCTTAFYLNENFCCWGAENGTSILEDRGTLTNLPRL